MYKLFQLVFIWGFMSLLNIAIAENFYSFKHDYYGCKGIDSFKTVTRVLNKNDAGIKSFFYGDKSPPCFFFRKGDLVSFIGSPKDSFILVTQKNKSKGYYTEPEAIDFSEYKAPVINANSFRNEPDGFRGLKWGLDINSIKPTLLKINEFTYYMKDDNYAINGYKVNPIKYVFQKGRFYSVYMTALNAQEQKSIVNLFRVKYGTPTNKDKLTISWSGNKSLITVNCPPVNNMLCTFGITSSEQLGIRISEIKDN